MTAIPPRVSCTAVLSPHRIEAVDVLAAAATAADGVPPLTDHALAHIRHGGDQITHVLVEIAAVLVAYAFVDQADAVDGPQAEIVVHPVHRASGHGRLLLTTLLERAEGSRLRLWAHGDVAAAQRLAEGMGFSRERVLSRMRRELPGDAAAAVPDGMRLRPFVPGADDEALVRVNNDAFAGHPEQGGWTLADLAARRDEHWFDPAGLLLLETADGALAGFVWTKVHAAAGHAHEPVGEIYVLGVARAFAGRGLGRLLTAHALEHLTALGLGDVMLYVDDSNIAAVALYSTLGFTPAGVDVLYRSST